MARKIMRRRASDNVYLHKDFHGALSCGIQYVHDHFGADAVREYLQQFAHAWYAPLQKDIAERGLDAVEDHFRTVFEQENGDVVFTRNPDMLEIRVRSCPAVRHIQERGMRIADLFFETTRIVNETICEGTGIRAELAENHCREGRCVQRFHVIGERKP